jgi:four helix bundle protein
MKKVVDYMPHAVDMGFGQGPGPGPSELTISKREYEYSSIEISISFLASMFDFEKLDVFNYSVEYYKELRKEVLKSKDLERYEKDQIGRSALSTVANIAEGNGVFSQKAKSNYFRISRGSLSESVGLLIVFKKIGVISEQTFTPLYKKAERISKILLALIKNAQSD